MNPGGKTNTAVLICIVGILVLSGCARMQYETVAMEWCWPSVPISSIPVALNFLGAQETSAIVTLANGSTYQADHRIVMDELLSWVNDPKVQKEWKAACEYVGKDHVFLRVIKRV